MISVLSGIACYSQNSKWILETGVPAENIYCVRVINNRLYAGSNGRLFVSNPGASKWEIIAAPGSEGDIEDVIKHNGDLYLASYGQGVLSSADDGGTWDIMANAGPFPIEFAEADGQLYVATGDRGVLRLKEQTSQWQPFNEGLYDRIESAFDCFLSASGTLVGGVSANGAVAVRDPKSQKWQIKYPGGRVSPGATTFDLLFAAGRIWAFTNQNIFISDDDGQTWDRAANGLPLGIDSKGFAVGDSVYAAINGKNGSSVLYRRLTASRADDKWVAFDTLDKIYIHSMASFNGRLYAGTQKGLYYMSTQNKPPDKPENSGISVYPNPARTSVNIAVPVAAEGFFELYTPGGRRIFKQPVHQKVTQLDISGLRGGQYVYRFSQMKKGKISGTLLISN